MLSSIGNTLDANGLRDMLRSFKKSAENIQEQSVSAVATSLISLPSPVQQSTDSSNMLSQNFAGATSQSRYVESTMASLLAEKQMTLQSHQVLAAAAKEMLAANGINATNCGSPAGAVMAMRRLSNKKAWKEFQKNLDEIKEYIEQNAEKATAIKNKNGIPIEDLPIESTAEVAPMPETANPEALAAVGVAPPPEVTASTATRPSIYIIV